jgi:hypothetical protein
MKKAVSEPEKTAADDDMLPEYDFRGGVRGKYAEAYRKGHTVRVHHRDGTTTIQHFTLQDGAVMLEPDVKEYFPDSESVNHALRTLIELIPTKRRSRTEKNRA